MVKQENPNFIASKYAPNPKEVSYWIDLATDSTGNVIKSYSPDLKKWIPLNRDANVDQWTHIKEIVQSVGLNYDKNSDVISLPDNSSNNYFKGTSIVDAINKGDAIVIISNGISSPLRFYSPFNLLGLYLIFIISYYL